MNKMNLIGSKLKVLVMTLVYNYTPISLRERQLSVENQSPFLSFNRFLSFSSLSSLLLCCELILSGCIENQNAALDDPQNERGDSYLITDQSDRETDLFPDLGETQENRMDQEVILPDFEPLDLEDFNPPELNDLSGLLNQDASLIDHSFDSDMESHLDSSLPSPPDWIWPDPLVLPPQSPPSEEQCDYQDNDQDGLTDEGVSSECGGCTPNSNSLEDEDLRRSLCRIWQVNALQNEDDEVNPQRLVNYYDLLSEISFFEATSFMNDSEDSQTVSCVRQSRFSALNNDTQMRLNQSLTPLTLTASEQEHTLIYSPESAPFYQFNPFDQEPFQLYQPQEDLLLQWPSSSLFPQESPRSLTLTAPSPWLDQDRNALAWNVTQMSQAWSQALQAPLLQSSSPQLDPLRWTPHPSTPVDAPASSRIFPQLKLYYGASASLSQTLLYRVIAHAQMQVILGDDGYFEWPQDLLSLPLSSHWIYLERSLRGWIDLGQHALQAQVGSRMEHRLSVGELPQDLQEIAQSFILRSPDPTQPQIDFTLPLQISWTHPLTPFGILGQTPLISLILKDNARTDLILCQIEEPAQNLVFPLALFDFWPSGPQSLRQLTLQHTFKEITFTYPDQGQLLQGASLILQLPASTP